ncbi:MULTISPECIES: heavy metal transporter CzcB [Streptomyces]|uniref:heavy metal transporter CzcB n=1 Tax=Streptomyces TaxID=1883 RepID=UPI001F5E8F8A|nr:MULTISPECIES: heavy metal transporter CzcB [Streptomyces]
MEPGSRRGHEQQLVNRIAVDAYHTAASLLLKSGDAPSAWISAERSMAAARRVGDPAAIATASRILTHAVAAVGHCRQGVGVAVRGADEVSAAVNSSQPDMVAVFGALLLRGAWAASAANDRDTASALLDEAERAAALMEESNRRWTAFGPNNVLLHKLTIALTLGDAGKALVEARRVKVRTLAVAERRAVFWTDVARALHACGRTQKATAALLAAEREAPQEVRSRRVVRELIGELLTRDRRGQAPLLRPLASRAGIPL